MWNTHDKDKLLKPCPFCGGKATLRSPKKMRTKKSFICSDVSCTKCGVYKASSNFDYKNPSKELSREEQDNDVIQEWNKRI